MTNQETRTAGRIRIYAAGGFGINIASELSREVPDGYSALDPVFIDTSRSNFSDENNIPEDHKFVLDEVDGGGKDRKLNLERIIKSVPVILSRFQPQDFNIVVFSGAGGSGSSFGVYLMRELLARRLPTIAIVVGAGDNRKSARNTLDVLKTLEGQADKTGLPVVVYYRQNGPDVLRSAIDIDCRFVIGSLSMLCSRQNKELDTADVVNWVQYNNTTKVAPRLARLMVLTSNEQIDQLEHPISIATLTPSADDPAYTAAPDYRCEGHPRHHAKIRDALPRHLAITFEGVPEILRQAEKRAEELERQSNNRVNHDRLVKDEEADTDGFVFSD